MTTLALALPYNHRNRLFWATVSLAVTLVLLFFGVTVNQALAMLLSMVVLTIWSYNRTNGLIAALLFFMVKPLFVRVAFAVDFNLSGSGGMDLLGITPALLLAALIIWHLFFQVAERGNPLRHKTRILLGVFMVVAFLSIFSSTNYVLVGLGGFERNVLPNMMVLLTASFLFTCKDDISKLCKVLLVLGAMSCLYSFGQYLLGLYPWEKDWILHVAFRESSAGWLTIGLRGVEFRLFSIFYNYMDFTFSNVVIFMLAISYGSILTGKWSKLRGIYVVLWILVLIISMERMPLLMTIAGIGVVYFMKSSLRKRKIVSFYAVLVSGSLILSLSVAGPYLKDTGAQKLNRLAELANPIAASSIEDRVNRKWGPTIATIKDNPLGVGIGYGSQTRANEIASQTNLWVEPHNEILQKTLETGVVGGTIYLLLLIAVFNDCRRLSRSKSDLRLLGYGMVAATIGFWLCGMVNVPFSGSSGLLYWAIAGAVIGVTKHDSENESHPANNASEPVDNIQ